MSKIQPRKNCHLFLPGHRVHWIQARKSWEDDINLPLPGRLVSTSEDGSVVIEVNGRQLRLWNHEAERIEAAAARTSGSISYQARWGLLFVASSPVSRDSFCVAEPSDGHVDCRETLRT